MNEAAERQRVTRQPQSGSQRFFEAEDVPAATHGISRKTMCREGTWHEQHGKRNCDTEYFAENHVSRRESRDCGGAVGRGVRLWGGARLGGRAGGPRGGGEVVARQQRDGCGGMVAAGWLQRGSRLPHPLTA